MRLALTAVSPRDPEEAAQLPQGHTAEEQQRQNCRGLSPATPHSLDPSRSLRHHERPTKQTYSPQDRKTKLPLLLSEQKPNTLPPDPRSNCLQDEEFSFVTRTPITFNAVSLRIPISLLPALLIKHIIMLLYTGNQGFIKHHKVSDIKESWSGIPKQTPLDSTLFFLLKLYQETHEMLRT